MQHGWHGQCKDSGAAGQWGRGLLSGLISWCPKAENTAVLGMVAGALAVEIVSAVVWDWGQG